MAEPDSTRERIIAAATAEFAARGIAGARVERIAQAARTSKERVYAHFRGKAELYRYVAGRELAAMAEAVPLDPTDLSGYAVRVHDHVAAHPARLRLMQWGQLELAADASPGDDPFEAIVAGKVEQLHRAQTAGDLDPGWTAADILTVVSQLATSGIDRDSVAKAVGRLFPARP